MSAADSPGIFQLNPLKCHSDHTAVNSDCNEPLCASVQYILSIVSDCSYWKLHILFKGLLWFDTRRIAPRCEEIWRLFAPYLKNMALCWKCSQCVRKVNRWPNKLVDKCEKKTLLCETYPTDVCSNPNWCPHAVMPGSKLYPVCHKCLPIVKWIKWETATEIAPPFILRYRLLSALKLNYYHYRGRRQPSTHS